MKRITGVLMSAEEITGVNGCKHFGGDNWMYAEILNEIVGTILVLKKSQNLYCDYIIDCDGIRYGIKKEWLKEIEEKEVVDWSKVPVDTKVIVWNLYAPSVKSKMHFAGYDLETDKIICWLWGQTSHSTETNEKGEWDYAELAEEV